MKKTGLLIAAISMLSLMVLAGCGKKDGKTAQTDTLSGAVSVDGSSTVFPVTEAVAEEFRNVAPNVRVTVGVSGTGGGFKKYVVGETDISDASRPIKKSEQEKAAANHIGYIELPIAYDGISVVINKENTWVDNLTVQELNLIWKAGSTVKRWNQIRPEWPDMDIRLFGPGVDSGTFDYFTEVINGKSQSCRSDFTMSEDDNVLVMGVEGEKGAMGFFGYAYYVENKDKLKVVPITNDKATVAPSAETINDGSYFPLSRPIFIYVNPASLEKPQVAKFVDFYLSSAKDLVREVGYVELSDNAYSLDKAKIAEKAAGTFFTAENADKTLEEKLKLR